MMLSIELKQKRIGKDPEVLFLTIPSQLRCRKFELVSIYHIGQTWKLTLNLRWLLTSNNNIKVNNCMGGSNACNGIPLFWGHSKLSKRCKKCTHTIFYNGDGWEIIPEFGTRNSLVEGPFYEKIPSSNRTHQKSKWITDWRHFPHVLTEETSLTSTSV